MYYILYIADTDTEVASRHQEDLTVSTKSYAIFLKTFQINCSLLPCAYCPSGTAFKVLKRSIFLFSWIKELS